MWYYKGKEFNSEDIPTGAIGFVYEITDTVTGMKYIGKKFFFSTKTLPPLKGTKKKRKKVTESDWKTYCGSSETVKSLVLENGRERFHREILRICYSKTELSYMELKEQMDKDVLLKPEEYHNAFCGGKINRVGLKSLFIKKLPPDGA